ncbi:MAG TPA: secretin N-terminal domain-containing protein [Thermoanaerobaculia bacterium]
MKRITIIIAALFIAAAALAQEKAPEPAADEYNTIREFRSKVFEVHNRDARDVAASVKLLGSGFKGSAISVNNDLHTITVRDFPENVAALEGAIARLDQPIASSPDIEMKISILIGSKTPLPGAATVPDELAPVVKQLESTLRYPHYGLLTATVQRTKPGSGVTGSGVAEPTLLGTMTHPSQPVFYNYRLRRITSANGEKPSIGIESFEFTMRVPVEIGGTTPVQYQPVGFETPVSIHQNEKVVIGTTTMGDKALIVVVTATVVSK